MRRVDNEVELYIGIDLAGSERRCTGVAIIRCVSKDCSLVFLNCLHSDDEILNAVIVAKNAVIAIDAPFSHAKGYREVDKEMIRRGYRVLPPSLGGMKMLTDRAIRLKNELESRGYIVIETHPRSALLSSSCKDVFALVRSLDLHINDRYAMLIEQNKDLRDAVISSIVAMCYAKKCSDVVKAIDGEIWILRKIC